MQGSSEKWMTASLEGNLSVKKTGEASAASPAHAQLFARTISNWSATVRRAILCRKAPGLAVPRNAVVTARTYKYHGITGSVSS